MDPSTRKIVSYPIVAALVSGILFYWVGKAQEAGTYTEKVNYHERSIQELEAFKASASSDIAVIKASLPSLLTTTEDLRKTVESLKLELVRLNRNIQ